jgi:predicted ATPase
LGLLPQGFARKGIAGRRCISGAALSLWRSIFLFELARPRIPGVAVALEVDRTALPGILDEELSRRGLTVQNVSVFQPIVSRGRAMLRQLKISNYKALRSVDVPLRPLTVLIGKNDTGKSTFLNAIMAVANGLSFSLYDRYHYDLNNEVLIEGIVTGGLKASVSSKKDAIPIKQDSICTSVLFQLPVAGVSMESDGWREEQGSRPLEPDGTGVPSLIDYSLRTDRDRFFELLKVIKEHVPGVQDIQISTPDPARRRLNLILEEGFRLPANEASSGVRFLLFFIALTYHPSQPKIILIEEPETGLHPRRLADVVQFLREITQGKHVRHPTQVVLSTHSPYLLDFVKPAEDQILVFQRLENGERTAIPADLNRLELFLEEFMLGEVWYNQGEEGMVPR